MLRIIAIILVVLWLFGFLAVHIASPLIHLIVVIAVIMFIYDLVAKRGKA